MVRIRITATSDEARAEWNAWQTEKAKNAKTGNTAKIESRLRNAQNKAAKEFGLLKPKTIKVDSNPVKPGKTVIGPLARKGGGGLGGMFGVKNR